MGLFDWVLAAMVPGAGAALTAPTVAEAGAKKVDEWTGAKAARDAEMKFQAEQAELLKRDDERKEKQVKDLEAQRKKEKSDSLSLALREAMRRRQRTMAAAGSRPAPTGTLLGGAGAAAKKTLLGY